MNNCKVILISLFILALSGCGIFPIQAVIKENHFRLENFKRDVTDDVEYVYLMCANKKPTTWFEPRQHISGEHDLWVKVKTLNRTIPHSTRVAIVNFKVDLDADKSYMLNRKIVDGKVSLWIQEVDTGLGVSDVLIANLKRPLLTDYHHSVKQCSSGSV
jgi:hypothetical protein